MQLGSFNNALTFSFFSRSIFGRPDYPISKNRTPTLVPYPCSFAVALMSVFSYSIFLVSPGKSSGLLFYDMEFNLDHSLEILERTPNVLEALLDGLSEVWTHQNEGGESWSAFDVLGHLIHGEKTDWIPRMQHILHHGDRLAFAPFDRFAQFEESKGQTLRQLLQEFTRLRQENLCTLKNTKLDERALNFEGLHPALGKVTLRQLLATWAVHDLGHIHQITRVMAKQYQSEVGPWIAYLGVLK